MRSASMAPNRLPASSPSWPVFARTSTTGDSGGMYQTIGIVRYSGCSGSATSNSMISSQIGELLAASIQSSGMPAGAGRGDHLGVVRVEEHALLRLVQVLLVGHAAASATLSAS